MNDPKSTDPVCILFDTDIGSDCDDAGALAVLHKLADRGEADILGVIYSSAFYPYGAGACDAINTYYGRGDLPIGQNHGKDVGQDNSMFTRQIAVDRATYGHRIVDDAPDMMEVYSSILHGQPDDSVTLLTVGHPIALVHLLRGEETKTLVESKVSRWVAMALGGWNFRANGMAPYMGQLLANWPTDIYVSPHGITVLTGHVKLPQQPPSNPLRRTYELFVLDGKSVLETGRPSWDQIATLYAVRPHLFRIDGNGSLEADATLGATWTRKVHDPKHFLVYPTVPDDELAELIEGLMVEPPALG
jgi:hypothetical protein